MRKRGETPDGVDTSNCFIGTDCFADDPAKCCFAVDSLQIAKCVRAVFKLNHGLSPHGFLRC